MKIPTNDPEQALAFCRQLAVMCAPAAPLIPRPDLSVVVPLHNEQGTVEELYRRIVTALETQSVVFELLFIDDASTDDTARKLTELVSSDERVQVVTLARNFGHQIALSAGLDLAAGNAVVLMDGDLQDAPEILPEFLRKWEEGYDVVYAVRVGRKESLLLRASYSIFYRILAYLADVAMPHDAGDFCLIDRRIVERIRAMPERGRFLRGLRSWAGGRQIGIRVERAARFEGTTKYTLARLLNLALEGIVSFSYVPLRIASAAGICVSVFSAGLAIFYFVKQIFFGLNPPGFATLTVLICFFSGIQLITIGIIGEYLGRVFTEVKRRPLYFIRNVQGAKAPAESISVAQ
ncbi:MAG: glycosyltransferase [Bdellovibrionales bacterium]|nr:glycosyltransferase [Bdellovibrionales bacterium]